jgi:UDP-N-acetyl-D-mannosaminuronic acid dehydrogenase
MMMNSRKNEVAIIGLGFVGLTLAIAFAEAGLNVLGVEKSEETLESLLSGKPTFYEPDLEMLLQKNLENGSLQISNDLNSVIDCENIVITIGTPWINEGVFLEPIIKVVEELADTIESQTNIILRSTVSVGTCQKLEEILNSRQCSASISMCPERTLEGVALIELGSLPQIIGSRSKLGREMSVELFRKIAGEVVILENPEEAELAKLMCNSFRDLKFAFANEIALFGHNENINVISAIKAANHNYPRAGIPLPGPVAGPCLEKDGHILASSILKSQDVSLAKVAREVNEGITTWVTDLVRKFSLGATDGKVAILGIAFKGKPPTSDIRGSVALRIIQDLRLEFVSRPISVWDPVSSIKDVKKYDLNWEEMPLILIGTEIVIIQNNHEYFSSGEFVNLISRSQVKYVIDLWENTDLRRACLDKTYVSLGGL